MGGVPAPADRTAAQDLDVMRIRNPTHCSYVMLIVDTRNITGAHRGGNASTYPERCIRSIDQNLLKTGWEVAHYVAKLRFGPPGNAVTPFASITT